MVAGVAKSGCSYGGTFTSPICAKANNPSARAARVLGGVLGREAMGQHSTALRCAESVPDRLPSPPPVLRNSLRNL